MKEIIDYIGSNSLLVLLISGVGVFFMFIVKEYLKKKDKIKEEKIIQYRNKPELMAEINSEKRNPTIELLFCEFTVEKNNLEQSIAFKYPDDLKIKNEYKFIEFKITNIGKSNISYLDIAVTHQKSNSLIDYQSVNLYVENGYINYSYCYDKKIRIDETILLKLYYLENQFDSLDNLLFLFKDEYNNLWEQIFFFRKSNTYEPQKIDYKDYRALITTDTAFKCFENPWLW